MGSGQPAVVIGCYTTFSSTQNIQEVLDPPDVVGSAIRRIYISSRFTKSL